MYLGSPANSITGCIDLSPEERARAKEMLGCGLGYIAPVGVVERRRSWKYVPPSIGRMAYESRIIPPTNLIESVWTAPSLGLVTGGMVIPEAPGLISESTLPTEMGSEIDAIFQNLDEFIREGGVYEEMPDWMKQMYDYLPSESKEKLGTPEDSEIADTIPTPRPAPKKISNKMLLAAGAAVVVGFFVLAKKNFR